MQPHSIRFSTQHRHSEENGLCPSVLSTSEDFEDFEKYHLDSMQLICRDGSLSVCMQDLAHASPMVLAGAVEAMCVDSYFCDAGQPCLRVEGSVQQWRLVMEMLDPAQETAPPSLEEVHALIPLAHLYDLAGLLADLRASALNHLQHSLTLTPPSHPTSVTRWLLLSDRLQLDDIRDICVDALGTYLLPLWVSFQAMGSELRSEFQRHWGPLLPCHPHVQLGPETAALVSQAVCRCRKCVGSAVSRPPTLWPPCSSSCVGPANRCIYPLASLQPELCDVCAFRPRGPPSMCSCCGRPFKGRAVKPSSCCGVQHKLENWAVLHCGVAL